MKKILWLASWYPNRLEPLTGDFIERHAKAASLHNSIAVIHVLRDHLNVTPGKVFKEKRIYNSNCEATIIYYKPPVYKIKWAGRVMSALIFLRYFIAEVNLHISQNGKPRLIHVHVSQKAGLVALWFKWFYKIRFVITEHWSGFCPGAHPGFDEQNLVSRLCWRVIMKQALRCSTVSEYLGISLKSRLKKFEYFIIPNVVDTAMFRPAALAKQEIFRFIHISSLNYQKNAGEIIKAIEILSTNTQRKFEVGIYGPKRPELITMIEKLNMTNTIVFKGELSHSALAADLKQYDALILYSLYETFGCVIIEANACGLPVIVSDIPVFHENVVENMTGIFVPLHQPSLLAAKMLWMMNNIALFNAKKIVELTKRNYQFEIVAQQFDAFYNEALKK